MKVAHAQNYVLFTVLCTKVLFTILSSWVKLSEVLFTALSAVGENGRKENLSLCRFVGIVKVSGSCV